MAYLEGGRDPGSVIKKSVGLIRFRLSSACPVYFATDRPEPKRTWWCKNQTGMCCIGGALHPSPPGGFGNDQELKVMNGC